MKINTRKLTCLSIILAIYFFTMAFPLNLNIPVVSVVLGLLIPIFGWKHIFALRTLLLLSGFIIKFHSTLPMFFINTMAGVSLVFSVSIMHYATVLITYKFFKRKLIF